MATLLNLVYMPSVLAAGTTINVANSGGIQYGVENRKVIPILLGPALTATNEYDSAGRFKIRDQPMPFNVGTAPSSGPALPTGPQWWPLTG